MHAMLHAKRLADDAEGFEVVAAQHRFRLTIIGSRIQQADPGARRQLKDELYIGARHLALGIGNTISLAELDRTDPQPAKGAGSGGGNGRCF